MDLLDAAGQVVEIEAPPLLPGEALRRNPGERPEAGLIPRIVPQRGEVRLLAKGELVVEAASQRPPEGAQCFRPAPQPALGAGDHVPRRVDPRPKVAPPLLSE